MRGWSFRLADRLSAARGGLLYANLGARGATTREILARQLERAVAMRPDLATLFSGTNDVLRPRFDARAFAADVLALQRGLRDAGALVLTFTLPDLSALLPLATDARFWNEDRIHANAAGHERIAAALAERLGLPGADASWREPLPPGAPPGAVAFVWRELRWSARHLVPWTLGAISGHGGRTFSGRRPQLEPVR